MQDFLAGGGPTGTLLRAHDWRATALGPADGWPHSLKALVSLMLASPQPMWVAWGDSRTMLYNEPYAQILAERHPAALGSDVLATWSDIRADVESLVAAAYRGETIQRERMPLRMLRGGVPTDTWFSFTYAPVRGDAGAVAGIFCICTDLTAQVRAEATARMNEGRLRGVLDHMGEALALLDHDLRVVEMNREGLRLGGRPRDQVIGRSQWELFPGTEDTPLGHMYRACIVDGVPRMVEHHQRWPDGREAWMEVRASRIPQGLVVFYHDVTARRRLQADADLSAERVQLALDAGAIVGTWVWEVETNHFLADDRFARSFGLDPRLCRTGLPLEQVMDSIHVDDRPRVADAIAEALGRGGPYRCEYRVRQSDGVFRWIEANGHVERTADGLTRFPGVLLDIESRRRVESERDEAAALMRAIVEAVPGVVYYKGLDGRMLGANRGTAELIGKPPEAFLGRTDLEFLEDKAQAVVIMANDRRIMASGQAELLEEDVRRPDGSPAKWLSNKAPMRDTQGQVIGLVGASIDISERKRIEEAIRESDRRKSEFLAVLSHELRNPLAPIRNGLHLLERAPDDGETARQVIEVIRRQSDHLARLVDDLLDMTRISRGKIELQRCTTDLRELARRAAADMQPQLADAGIALQPALGEAPVWIDADETRISQVLGNLLHNAMKFTPAGGHITLALDSFGGRVRLAVRDSGAGMAPGTIEGMFEPFAQGEQSLARTKGGLGLGLPLVRGLVEMHGGRITGDSAGPGQGSTFTVDLPLAATPAPATPAPDAAPAAAPVTLVAGLRVLIIEDNRDAAQTLAQLLELEGHSASVAASAVDGLALARAAAPDVVLCDIGLPDMDGYALAQALRAEPALSAIRLVALSGYAQPADRQRSAAAGFDEHLAKPPDLSRLLALLAQA